MKHNKMFGIWFNFNGDHLHKSFQLMHCIVVKITFYLEHVGIILMAAPISFGPYQFMGD